MKLSLVLLVIMFAASCVLATPKTVKSFKSSSQLKMSARLQSLHKSVRPLSARLSKMLHHKYPVTTMNGKPALFPQRKISCKVVKEEPILLQDRRGFYMSFNLLPGQTTTQGIKVITDSTRMLLLTTDCGKVAFFNPATNFFLTATLNEENSPVWPILTDADLAEMTSNQDGTVVFRVQDGRILKSSAMFSPWFGFVRQIPPQFDRFSLDYEYFKMSSPPPRVVVKEQVVALRAKDGSFVSATGDQLGGSKQAGDSERFTIVTLEEGKVAIRTPDGKGYLTAVYTTEYPSSVAVTVVPYLEAAQLWILVTNPDGSISFYSMHRTYLRAMPSGSSLVVTHLETRDDYEKFNFVEPPTKPSITYPHELVKEEIVAFRTFDGGYLSAGPSGVGLSSSLGPAEKFSLLRFDNGKVALRTAQGLFLQVQPGTEDAKVALASRIEDDAAFDLFANPDETVTLRSVHSTFLRAETVDGAARVDAQSLMGMSGLFRLVDPSKQ